MTSHIPTSACLDAPLIRRFLADRSPAPGIYVETGEAQPTLEALRWAAEITSMLGDPIDEEMLVFITACCRSEAFAMRVEQFEPDLGATYYATRVLALAQHRSLLPGHFVSVIAQRLFAANGAIAVDVDGLFYGIRALEEAALRLPRRQAEQASAFICACAAPEGGYAVRPGAVADIERTYCCLQMQRILNHGGIPRWREDKMRAIRDAGWVDSCMREKAVYLTPQSEMTSLAATYWGTHAARLCGLPFPEAQVNDAVEAAWRSDGGFGNGDRATLWDTYCALRLLSFGQAWTSS